MLVIHSSVIADQTSMEKTPDKDSSVGAGAPVEGGTEAAEPAGPAPTAGPSALVMLGSSSKWRASLIAGALPAGFALHAERLSPDIDEKAIRRDDAKEMVVAIAQAKTDRLLELLRERPPTPMPDFVLCADQVIVFDGTAREKPESAEQCKAHLQSYGLQDKPAECTSGLVVTHLASGVRCAGVDVAVQHFKPVPDDVADALIAKGDVMYCAGSFVAEDELLQPFLGERIGEIESVQGMPIALTCKLLHQAQAEAQAQAQPAQAQAQAQAP